MTTLKGRVRVPMDLADTSRLSKSLLVLEAMTKPQPTLLVPLLPVRNLRRLVRTLRAPARSDRTCVQLFKEDAEYLVLVAFDVCAIRGIAPPSLALEFAHRCKLALNPRGRPRLTRAQQQMWVKTEMGDIRDRRRYRHRERIEEMIQSAVAGDATLLTMNLAS